MYIIWLNIFQVTVADPTTVAALEASQQQCKELQAKINSMERTIKKLEKNKSTTTTVVKQSSSKDKDLKLLLQTLLDVVSLVLLIKLVNNFHNCYNNV